MTSHEGLPSHDGLRDNDQLRHDLIIVAQRLLASGPSPESLSIGAVARELGIPPSSVSECFPDRMSLALAVYRRYFALLAHHIDRVTSEFTDPEARLRATAVAYCQFAADYPDVYYVLFTLPGITGRQDDVPDDERPGTTLIQQVQGVVSECVAAGVIHRVDPYQATLCLWASLHGLISLRINRPQVPWPPFDALVDTLLSTILCRV
jgi:AcrR family transcriptional regulator